MLSGLVTLPWWAYLLITLILTHITIAGVTIYLHRHQAHRALELHPIVSHFFRFWLWITTGMNTKQWVAVHRKHHAKVEQADDPHSPVTHGINKVLWDGVELYREESLKQETLDNYGHETPDDWIERHLYTGHPWLGINSMLVINFVLFGFVGISIWAVQMMWIPFFAAGVINGLGHFWGYRNFDSPDAATNIIPIGILIGGEEMHNNHHAFASSARFSNKWWEFDVGWFYIKLMSFMKLAKVKKVAPKPLYDNSKLHIDVDTVKAIISNRLHVMSDYARSVVVRTYKEERSRAKPEEKPLLKRAKRMLTMPQFSMDDMTVKHLEELLDNNETLKTVYEFKQRLQLIWQEKSASHEALIQALQEWCKQAEASGVDALREFSESLRSYSMQPA